MARCARRSSSTPGTRSARPSRVCWPATLRSCRPWRCISSTRSSSRSRRATRVSPCSGQVLLEYKWPARDPEAIGERAVSAAIARLTTTRAPWVAVLEGHGERQIDGEAPSDLGRFGQELEDQGFLARPRPGHRGGRAREHPPAGGLHTRHPPLPRRGPASLIRVPGSGRQPALADGPGTAEWPGATARGPWVSGSCPASWWTPPRPSLGVDTPAVAVITDFPEDDPPRRGLSERRPATGCRGLRHRDRPRLGGHHLPGDGPRQLERDRPHRGRHLSRRGGGRAARSPGRWCWP